ncbi:hypothetical protein ONZ43_g1312 [Nemania bipapillata]|uniref:Uncharacterized protein n=1 Tax=Nemania bipapillata TaxID=110536 RepID=A0ACC2J4Z0_9PEZI|nr:hypothetical protein ONZ43_g1312 [Nemania bipapillata]
MSVCSLDGGTSEEIIEFSTQYSTGERRYPGFLSVRGASGRSKDEKPAKDSIRLRRKPVPPTKHTHGLRNISLRNRSHVSIDSGERFSLTRSARRQPTIARDWSPARKRFVAAVACTSTALIGVLIGIYAGLVPSIQYYIADFYHYTILGNVGLYLGMALPNLFCWPLPLLHGRKPYIVGGLCVAMPLLFPQALAIGARRSPNTCVWRVALLLPRALMGFVLGFANMNFHSVLTDLFGASLMSKNPHQEVVDEYDVRRHGGGLGVWLGIWTWCFIGSLGVGFVVGAVVIEYLQPSWGLYISVVIIAVVLLLNVLCPEVRRSAWRRSVAEVRTGETISRRLARGEVMMHRVQTGPRWWGQEVYHGVALSLEMLRQPGFTIMAVYSAWIYAQIVLVIVLLGSLTSKSYRFRSPYVGAVVSSVAIGAFAAIPFQKANLFSRARKMSPKSNTMTFDRKITWSSRLRPAILGNPVDRYRRVNILELGSLTRWTEIRKRNRLIDENAHLNRQAVALARDELQHSARHSAEKVMHKVSKRSLQSKCSHESSEDDEPLGPRPKRDAHSAGLPVSPSVSPSPDGLGNRLAESHRDREGTTSRNLSEVGDVATEGENYIRRRSRSQNFTSQTQASADFETQPVRGRSSSVDDVVVLMEVPRRVIDTVHGSGGHAGEDAVVDDVTEAADPAENTHKHEDGVKPTDQEFEDVKLDDSEKKTPA